MVQKQIYSQCFLLLFAVPSCLNLWARRDMTPIPNIGLFPQIENIILPNCLL